MMQVELGCGRNKPVGAFGIDLSADSDADLIHDLRNGIPLPDESATIVSSNHFLEHVAVWPQLLWETWRVLVPGGTMTFRVPYVQSQGAIDPAHPAVVSEHWLRHCWEMHACFAEARFEFEYDAEMLRWARATCLGAPDGVLRRLFWNVALHMRYTATAVKPRLDYDAAMAAKAAALERWATT